jgi:hypothetical protein
MVWFASDVVSSDMIMGHLLQTLQYGTEVDAAALAEAAAEAGGGGGVPRASKKPAGPVGAKGESESSQHTKAVIVSHLRKLIMDSDMVMKALEKVRTLPHIMVYTDIRVIQGMFSLLKKMVQMCVDFNEN